MQYQTAKDPDVSPRDQRPQLETGGMAPTQHGCSGGDETGPAPGTGTHIQAVVASSSSPTLYFVF